MLNPVIKYSYADIKIIPAILSNVEHRGSCNVYDEYGNLPIFTAPMSSVVNTENMHYFIEHKITPILPRNIDINTRISKMNEQKWVALSLNEFEDLFITNSKDRIAGNHYYICVDLANGHMKNLLETCIEAKNNATYYGYELIIMTGNIGNPKTYIEYCKAGIDYIRCSIGTGSGCITTPQTGIHYPIASLIAEIREIKEQIKDYPSIKTHAKIIADGGVKNYDDVVKAIALGADYVMIGGLFSQLIESAGEKYDENNNKFDINMFKSLRIENEEIVYGYYNDNGLNKKLLELEEQKNTGYYSQHLGYYGNTEEINEFINLLYENEYSNLKNGQEQYIGKLNVKFFGMASADGQKSISGEKTKTSEGITKYIPVKYTLNKWTENMISYLQSTMSYCDSFDYKQLYYKAECIIISENTYNSINK